MTLGRQLRRPELPTVGARWCEAALPEGSVYRFLARERARLFPAELFADLFRPTGRRSVPPSILAVVMVLQRLEGLSDREAADRFAFDVRWRYAAGVADAVAGEETASFAHTVLVDFRARLRRSTDPDRIFRVTCQLAREVGLVGVRRVLDSAPLEDAVATQDTVTTARIDGGTDRRPVDRNRSANSSGGNNQARSRARNRYTDPSGRAASHQRAPAVGSSGRRS